MTSRAVFLTTQPDPTFAMVHLPKLARSDGTGVIVCPAFAGEDLFLYRTRRAWAEALAGAGHPALRFDLPGIGDSAGSSLAPDRLESWKAVVAEAAGWLREDIGCARIAAVGIGFGGMLAWMAAAEGAPIDDFMLWGVPLRGRRLLREVKAAGLMDIDRDSDLEALELPESLLQEPDVVLLDEAGQMTTRETFDELARVDLATLELPQPAGRRVLLFKRTGDGTDECVSRHFRTRGSDVTVADGDSYAAMMQYVELSVVPTAAIAQSIFWLAGSDSLRGPAPPRAKPVDAVSEVMMRHDGATVRELMLTTEVDSVVVRGVITEPADLPANGICAVFFSGGSDRRIGPNRLWVELARRWAAHGVTSVRIDSEGIGDADGDHDYWATRRGHYDPRHVPKTVALLDALQARGLPSRFLLVGFCSGAYRSFQVARADRRIAGVFAIAFPFFFWNNWTLYVRHSWVRGWKRRSADGPLKSLALWTLRSLWRTSERIRSAYVRFLRPRPDKVDRALEQLGDQNTELLLLYRSNSVEYYDLFKDRYMPRIEAMPNVRVKRIPGPDVRFRPLPLQRFVSDELDAALSRVIEANRSDPASAPALKAQTGSDLGDLTEPLDSLRLKRSATEHVAAAVGELAPTTNAVRTLVIARTRSLADGELRREIAADSMPDVIGPDDAIGATHIDERYFAELPGLHGRICRRLPTSLAQPLEVLLRGRQYDAVVTWSDAPAIALATLTLFWRRRPAHIAILMWPSKSKKALPLRALQRGIDRFIVCSPLQRQFLEEQIGIAPERFGNVKGRRIDTHFWRPMPGADDVICSVGQEMRDYATLVRALGPLDIPCHIAPGAGIVSVTSAKWWRHSLEEGRIPDNVSVESRSYAGLRDLYARSRFVVVPLLPSDTDNGVTTVLEAFAMGKAVICTDSPGQGDLIADGVNGLLVPAGDPTALRQAILEMWNDPARCARMGAAGRRFVLERHGLSRWTESLVAAVDDAVASRGGGGRLRGPEPVGVPR